MTQFRSSAALLSALLLATACTNGDSVLQPNNSIESIPWVLKVNHKAITALVGEQIQLSVKAYDVNGNEFTGTLPAVQWSTTDTTVKVDQNGLVYGNAVKSSVSIIAKIQNYDENWTVADTARLMTVSAPFTFASYKLVLSGDTVVPANRSRTLDATLYTSTGAVVNVGGSPVRPTTWYTTTALPTLFYFSNPFSNSGSNRNVGNVTARGRAYIFGQEYEDSVKFRITYPDSAILYIYQTNSRLNPSPSMMSQTDLTVLKGGWVAFRNNNTTMNADIVFDDLVNVPGGNIATVPTTPSAGKPVQFLTAGKYTYHSTIHGFGGTITVVDP